MATEAELKPFACSTCVQRKVKCDKIEPCGSCTRSRLQCYYRPAPLTNKRKRRTDTDADALLEIVRSHESLLRKSGVAFQSVDAVKDNSSSPNGVPEYIPPQPRAASPQKSVANQRGILLEEHGGKRYYDYGLIGTLGQPFTQDATQFHSQYGLGTDNTPSASHESPQDVAIAASLVTGGVPPFQVTGYNARVRRPGLYPRLWNVFLENVHPLTMAVYPPSVAKLMHTTEDLQGTPADALRLAVCCCALSSLTDKETKRLLGESQASLLFAFQQVTRSLLLETQYFRAPDMDLLTAHALLVTSMLHTSDSSSLWIIMGSTIRLAQLQGLHRDGSGLGLAPFEAEMRRRLWWYIVTLDIRMTELIGLESALPRKLDAALPANVNDSEIWPEMKTSPVNRNGATEMTFCLLKYEISRYLLENDGRFGNFPSGDQPKRTLADLESLLEERFLKYCHPVVPVQFLTTIMARSFLCKLKQLAQHRKSRHHADEPEQMSQQQLDSTLSIATRSVEYDNLIHCNRSLAGYRWHVHFYFPWGAPIFILKILESRQEWTQDMYAAWAQIEELHEHHPEYLEADTVVHLILNGLTLKAWKSHDNYERSRGAERPPLPELIAALLRRHGTLTPGQQQAQQQGQPQAQHQIPQQAQQTPQLDYSVPLNGNGQPHNVYQTDNGQQFNLDMAFGQLQGTALDFLDPGLISADWSEWSGY